LTSGSMTGSDRRVLSPPTRAGRPAHGSRQLRSVAFERPGRRPRQCAADKTQSSVPSRPLTPAAH
jgi:hypothetical protein